MLSTTISPHCGILTDRWRIAAIFAIVVIACALGWLIASENWLLIGGSIGLFLVLLRPIETGLGLYAFLIPFESMTIMGDGNGPATTLLRYVGLLALFVTVGIGWLRDRITKPPRSALFWSLFIFWVVASTQWAIDPQLALARLPTALGLWLLYLAIVSVRIPDREFSWVALLTISGGCGASLYSAYTFFQSGSAIGRVSLAEGSTLSDPNFFAATLLLPLSQATGEVLVSSAWWRRVLFLAGTGVIALALFLTMSRGALLALMTIVLVFLARLRMNWRLLLPTVAFGAALLFMPRLFFERVQEASTSRAGGRQDIWVVGIHSLKTYGAFGAGVDNFSRAYQRYEGAAYFFAGDQRDAHNVYLCTSVEFGILGILFLFKAVSSHLRAFPRPSRNNVTSTRLVAFEAACWAMLVMGFSLDLLWRKTFWFVWALSAAAMRIQKDEQLREVNSLSHFQITLLNN
jgi:O-antigen ligase